MTIIIKKPNIKLQIVDSVRLSEMFRTEHQPVKADGRNLKKLTREDLGMWWAIHHLRQAAMSDVDYLTAVDPDYQATKEKLFGNL